MQKIGAGPPLDFHWTGLAQALSMEHETLTGEVWVDERGEAVVVLPDHLHGRELEVEHRLRCSNPAVQASAVLADGHLTITSEAPHAKVAWRLAYRTTADAACRKGASR